MDRAKEMKKNYILKTSMNHPYPLQEAGKQVWKVCIIFDVYWKSKTTDFIFFFFRA